MCLLKGTNDAGVGFQDSLTQGQDVVDQLHVVLRNSDERLIKGEVLMMTYRIRAHGACLLKHLHSRLEVRREAFTDSQSNVTKTAENGRLGRSVQDSALEVREEDLHEALSVGLACRAERSADVADEPDRDRTKLILLM